MEFEKIVRENPVLAAVKDEAELEEVLKSDGVQIIFVLFGDVCIIPWIVERIKDRGKFAIVHADLVEGLSSKEVVVDYLKSNTRLDGIISTKQSIIRRGIELGLFTVLRCFVLDTKSLINLQRWLDSGVKPDGVEPVSYTHLDVYKRQAAPGAGAGEEDCREDLRGICER